MKKYFISLVFATVLLFAAGCTTTFITSNPPGADIIFNGGKIGQTPMEYKVKQPLSLHGNKYKFTVLKEGYKSESVTLYETPSQRVGEVVPSKIHFILTPLENNSTSTPAAETQPALPPDLLIVPANAANQVNLNPPPPEKVPEDTSGPEPPKEKQQ